MTSTSRNLFLLELKLTISRKFTAIEVLKCAPRNITVNQYEAHNMISNFPCENVSVRAKIYKFKLLSV
jgi:hypothetical protein